MEGSGIAKPLIRGDTNEIFRRAGLPASAAAAWVKARPRVKGALKRDSAAGTNFWRRGADLLEKLSEKVKAHARATTGGGNYPV